MVASFGDTDSGLPAQRRHDRILSLREALRVARAVGIESVSSLAVAASKEKATIEVNTLWQESMFDSGFAAIHHVAPLAGEPVDIDPRQVFTYSAHPMNTGSRDAVATGD